MSLTYQQAVEQTITAAEQFHQIVNGTGTAEVSVEDGSTIPSVRKALLDNFYFKDPIPWVQGNSETVFNQLRNFTDGSWWYAPNATVSNPVVMGITPIGDSNWKIFSFDALYRLSPRLFEALRRTYQEAGYQLSTGSFQTGATLLTDQEVLVDTTTGKCYSWTGTFPKLVAPNSSPVTGWVDKSTSSLRSMVLDFIDDVNFKNGKVNLCYIETYGNDTTAQVNSEIYPFKTISAALAATTGAVVLKVGLGSFEWVGALRSGVCVEGSGMPSVASDQSGFLGGTVLYTSGTGGFPGGVGLMRGITFSNLGILAKGKSDGLIIAAPAGSGTASGVTLQNIVTLADQTSNHSCLLENLENLTVRNLITYGGISGLAIKAVNFTVSDTKHYDAQGAYLTLRESPYALCRNGVVNNVVGVHKLRTAATSAGIQFLNNEEGCEMSGIEVNNVVVSGVLSGYLMDNQTNTKSATDVSINKITVYGSDDFAATINGNAKSISITDLTANNCTGVLKLSVASGFAPTDCFVSNINIIAGAKSISRPILNEGVRTSLSGIKSNLFGMNIFNPVIENSGTDLVISGVQYIGSIVVDTGSGYHSIIEGEGYSGVISGPATAGVAIATKRFDGRLSVSIRNSIINATSTVFTIPASMAFKTGNTGTPAQIRQNYSITISGYLNAGTPTASTFTLLAFPLSPTTFQVNLTADPAVVSNGVVVACNLEGVWK